MSKRKEIEKQVKQQNDKKQKTLCYLLYDHDPERIKNEFIFLGLYSTEDLAHKNWELYKALEDPDMSDDYKKIMEVEMDSGPYPFKGRSVTGGIFANNSAGSDLPFTIDDTERIMRVHKKIQDEEGDDEEE